VHEFEFKLNRPYSDGRGRGRHSVSPDKKAAAHLRATADYLSLGSVAVAVTVGTAATRLRAKAGTLQHAGNQPQSAAAGLIEKRDDVDVLAADIVDTLTSDVPTPSLPIRPHSRPQNADGFGIGAGDFERACGSSGRFYGPDRLAVTGCRGSVRMIKERHWNHPFDAFAAVNSVARLRERPPGEPSRAAVFV
jgi:hypothetical protein